MISYECDRGRDCKNRHLGVSPLGSRDEDSERSATDRSHGGVVTSSIFEMGLSEGREPRSRPLRVQMEAVPMVEPRGEGRIRPAQVAEKMVGGWECRG